ncbi:MAG: RNA polymerase sigma factor [Idiomarina sp.]|nr:RNA polymerase sigma factor [Idiomarina sp.]
MNQAELMAILPALRRFAFSLTHSVPDTDDLVQNTIERILTKASPEQVDVTKWAFRICRNLWIDEYRAQKVRAAVADNPDFEQPTSVEGERQIMQEINLTSVGQAMQQLPAEQLTVLSMIAVQGCSYRETAEALDIPVGTVMSRLSRARISLNRLISPEPADEGASCREVH